MGSGVQELGLENQDGDITYTDFKGYIEGKDVETSAGKAPGNLVAFLMANRMDVWLEDNEVTRIFSPRSWRAKLTGDDSYTTKSPKKGGWRSMNDDEGDDDEDDGAKKKKDKKKDKGDDDDNDKKDKKDKKEKKEEKEEEEEAEDDGKKDKKDKKEKKEGKEEGKKDKKDK